MLAKAPLFAIQSPEGPNIFHPEALPVWMRPAPPGGDGAAGGIGAAAAVEPAPANGATKESTLNQKFGGGYSNSDTSQQSQPQSQPQPQQQPQQPQQFQQSQQTQQTQQTQQSQPHHHHHHHHHHLHRQFQEAGDDGAAAAGGQPAAGGIPTEGIPQGDAGGVPTSGPLPPALPANPQVGMMYPAGSQFSGAPNVGIPPPMAGSEMGGVDGTTPFHISTMPMVGGMPGNGKMGASAFISPVMPGAPGPTFKR